MAWKNAIVKEISALSDDYLLNVDEMDYKDYLIDKYSLDPLIVLKETESVSNPEEFIEDLSQYNDAYAARWGRYRKGLRLTVSYQFEGNPQLFDVRPNPFSLISNKIHVDNYNHSVSFNVEIFSDISNRGTAVAEFNKEKEDGYRRAFTNLQNLNACLKRQNPEIEAYINQQFDFAKKRITEKNVFFAAIHANEGIRSSTYTIPVIKKRIYPIVTSHHYQLSPTPTISTKVYGDIIREINRFGHSVESKISLYKGKDEEALRDLFVANLESHFEFATVTSETFNHKGKTDILIRNAADDSNLFIAECKIWHGEKKCLDAIDQLFDRYLTWRDSKVALILFVKGKNFTDVLNTIRKTIPQHTYYKKELEQKNGESSFSYLFKFPHDVKKNVYLEVIAFNFSE